MIANDNIIQRIEATLEELRPYLNADSGDIQLLEVTDDMIARVQLLGACSSCSMSMMTMKAGVEESILRAVPEIKAVEAVSDL
ncbi:MAG: NifU family protein [Bacteroidia bacterium]